MKKNIFIGFFMLFIFSASAQNDSASNLRPTQKVWLNTTHGDQIKGVLISTTDSSVNIFPGNFSEWNHHSKISMVSESYPAITDIKTHKKGGIVKGVLIGAGIAIAPVIIGSIFGESTGQAGAIVSILAFPVAIITGAIVGSTSRKKFFISGDKSKFLSFHKRMKY